MIAKCGKFYFEICEINGDNLQRVGHFGLLINHPRS